MWEGYLSLAGNEAINSGRAIAGALAHGLPVTCTPCDGIAAGLDDPPYTGSPRTDDAPWYDKYRPASSKFLGVLGLEVSGFTTAAVDRTTTDLLGDGSALGSLRRPAREMVYTVALLALDDEGMSYGYEWLSSLLRSGGCNLSCAGITMCVMGACPTSKVTGAALLRTLYDVGVTDGLTETARQYLSSGGHCDDPAGCCADTGNPLYSTATFTLTAGTPYIYRPEWPVDEGAWSDLADGDLLTGYDPDAIADDCPTVVSCLADPDCTVPALPPTVSVPANPCWPTGTMTARRTWLTVPPLLMSQWSEMVPIIEVYTGSAALRRLIVRFYSNPAGLDCVTAGADPCASCTSVNIAYLPERSTLLLDGRTQTAVVDCSTTLTAGSSSPTLYGPSGATFTWPVFDCPTGLCIEVIAQASTVTDTTQVRMYLAPRGDAG